MAQPATLSALVLAHARATPRAAAILASERTPLAYQALARQMADTGAAFARAGYGRGSRVALALGDGAETAVAVISVMSCATCVPINPDADASAVRAVLSRARVDVLVIGERTPAQISEVARDSGVGVARLAPIEGGDAGTHTIEFEHRRAPVALQATEADDVALVLHTSGTTGLPKIVPLTNRSQTDEALHRVSYWRLSAADCAICVTPLFTASGLRRNLFPLLAAGGRIVCPPALDGDRLYDWLARFEPTFYAAGPAVHKALLEAVTRRGRPPKHTLRYITSGTTALPADLQESLEQTLAVPVIQSYAMTETGGIAQNPLPPAARKPGSVGYASQGEIATVDGERFLARGETGEIVVRGPQVFAGYEGDAQANRDAFLGDWFRTGDMGYIDEDGYLFVTGRVKEIVNRGGFKVSPSEVDAALARHPDVKEAAACGVPHASLGEDVVAAVVAREGARVAEQQLRDFAFTVLADYKVPTRIAFVDAIPRTALGKVRRRELAAMLAQTARPAFTAPCNERELIIARTFAEVLRVDRVGRTDNFFALGCDSLRSAQVVARVKAAFGREVAATTLFRRPTVAELAAEIDASPAAMPPIVALPRKHAQ